MKLKLEKQLDVEFEKMGVKQYVYHFTSDVYPFRAVTLATKEEIKWKGGKALLDDIIGAFFLTYALSSALKQQPARKIKKVLEKKGYGVAICDKRDQFNRHRGRIIAKGRLLKHLGEEM